MIEMKVLPKLCGLLALVFALGTARSDTFDFSYVFGDGLSVTGSLDGTANGNFIENVTNVSVFFDGNALAGTIFASQFDGASYLDGPIISFDALQNNFVFANSDLVNGDFGFDSIFYMLNASVFSDTAVAYSALGYASQDDPTVPANWSLSRAVVPDRGTTLALLALGLVMVVWFRTQVLSAPACTVRPVRG
jgi:hypothetical protein